MKTYCQRDSKWGNIKLGTSNTLIKDYGCTITSLGMIAEITPDEVNRLLNSVNGFSQGNLIIWSKINECFKGVEFGWRGYTYENEKVSQAIKDNGACMVEVDAAPIGGYRHWVVFIGNKQLVDPWDGKVKPTSTYSPTGYTIIKIKETMKDTEMVIDRTLFGELVTKSTKYDELVKVGVSQPQDVVDLKNIIKEEKASREKAELEAKGAREELTYWKQQLADKLVSTQDLPRILGVIDELLSTVDNETKQNKTLVEQVRGYEVQASNLKGEIKRLELLLKQGKSINQATAYELLIELVKRMTAILKRN